jgi:2,4-dienoyl-CoA reductase (NADPH2)
MPSAQALKQAVSIPVVGVGRINSRRRCRRLSGPGQGGFGGGGRQFIADAHWPNKALAGRSQDVRRCIACNVCLDILLANKLPLTCAVNPSPIKGR